MRLCFISDLQSLYGKEEHADRTGQEMTGLIIHGFLQ